MRLTSISCIMNDADIIETFVRVNASIIDTFIFIDDSDDGTSDILKCLEKEGFRIICFYRDKSETFHQNLMVMSALHFAIDQHIEGDYFFLLDSDEFPKFHGKEDALNVLKTIPLNHIGTYEWETYLPDNINFEQTNINGLQTCFSQRIPEGRTFEKIIIPRAIAKEINISIGSHSATSFDGHSIAMHPISQKLAHFPVRSTNQILKKNISAVYWLMRKKSSDIDEGYHVYEVLKRLADNKFQMSLKVLRNVAIEYANEGGIETQKGEKPSWIQPYELRYTEHSNDVLIKNICNLLINSWINPFTKDQTDNLNKVMRSI
jgi:hypothetical protein